MQQLFGKCMKLDMKLGPVTKLDKRNKTTSKTFDNDIMSTNCDITVIFSIYGQFGATGSWIPDALSIKLTFSLTLTFYLTKTENRTKKSLTHLSHYCFE